MIGAMYRPINPRKKAPLGWGEIRAFVLARREEVGIPAPKR